MKGEDKPLRCPSHGAQFDTVEKLGEHFWRYHGSYTENIVIAKWISELIAEKQEPTGQSPDPNALRADEDAFLANASLEADNIDIAVEENDAKWISEIEEKIKEKQDLILDINERYKNADEGMKETVKTLSRYFEFEIKDLQSLLPTKK